MSSTPESVTPELVLNDISKLPRLKGLLIEGHSASLVDGPFDGAKIRSLVRCDFFQMSPILDGEFELWYDEEGLLNKKPINELFSKALKSVFLGDLCGNVVVVHKGAVP